MYLHSTQGYHEARLLNAKTSLVHKIEEEALVASRSTTRRFHLLANKRWIPHLYTVVIEVI